MPLTEREELIFVLGTLRQARVIKIDDEVVWAYAPETIRGVIRELSAAIGMDVEITKGDTR